MTGSISLLRISLALFVLTGVLFFNSGNSLGQQPECPVVLGKDAPGAGDLEFVFITTTSGGDDQFVLIDGQTAPGNVEENFPVTIVEELPNGWVLESVDCETAESVQVEEIENGIRLTCLQATEELSSCTFNNILLEARPIPTLSQWGMIAAVVGLGLIGLVAVRRRAASRT